MLKGVMDMKSLYYRLEGRKVIPCSIEEFHEEQMKDRRVADITIENRYRVSTVFLGIDHSFGGDIPLVFETMVFRPGRWDDIDCIRSATWDEALEAHRKLVMKYRKKVKRETEKGKGSAEGSGE